MTEEQAKTFEELALVNLRERHERLRLNVARNDGGMLAILEELVMQAESGDLLWLDIAAETTTQKYQGRFGRTMRGAAHRVTHPPTIAEVYSPREDK